MKPLTPWLIAALIILALGWMGADEYQDQERSAEVAQEAQAAARADAIRLARELRAQGYFDSRMDSPVAAK